MIVKKNFIKLLIVPNLAISGILHGKSNKYWILQIQPALCDNNVKLTRGIWEEILSYLILTLQNKTIK